jgi:hypothetical protein
VTQNSKKWFVIGLSGGLLVCLVTVLVLYFTVLRPSTIAISNLTATVEQQDAVVMATQSSGVTNTSAAPTKTSQPASTSESPEDETTPEAVSGKLFISAKYDTNCREGPDTKYPIMGHFIRGQSSEVNGTNSLQTWWYIKNPDNPDDYCWVWGETTFVEGDTGDVSVVPPPPPPPPGPDFDLFYQEFTTCYGTDVVLFKVENSGDVNLESMTILIINSDTQNQLFWDTMSNQPFWAKTNDCGATWGYIEPGEVAYVGAPVITSGQLGDEGYARIKLCEEESLKGRCVERTAEFSIPYQ